MLDFSEIIKVLKANKIKRIIFAGKFYRQIDYKKNVSKEVVQKDKINKTKVSSIIFNKNEVRKKLEKYIHKEVKTSRESFIKKNLERL